MWNLSQEDRFSSSLNFWQNSAVKLSGPGLLFVGRFLITVSISMLMIGLLRFSISSWFNFGKLYFSKKCVHFFQVVHFIGIQLLIVVSYDPLYFCVACCDFSIFIPNFVDLIPLPFFLMSLANDLSILFIFSKNQLLALLISFIYLNVIKLRKEVGLFIKSW